LNAVLFLEGRRGKAGDDSADEDDDDDDEDDYEDEGDVSATVSSYFCVASRFQAECSIESDGQLTCHNCPDAYTGRRCEQCAPGFEGNPLIRGEVCRPITGMYSFI